MSRASLLLRVLLLISLLVNGLGVAVAGSHGAASPSPAAQPSAAPPCHDGTTAAALPPGGDHHATHDQSDPQAPDGKPHCTGIDCLRACAQQPALTFTALVLPRAPAIGSQPERPLDQGLPSPLLPTLHRPPIA